MKIRKCLMVIWGLLFLTGIGNTSWATPKTVLIIYSYHENMTWTRQCDQGIREALPDDVLIERFYMDTKRISANQFEEKARAAVEAFNRIQPDLVMLSDDNALRLVGPELAATGIPVVYLGINGNPRSYFDTLPANVTGVLERIPLFHWVRFLFDIVPGARSVLLLLDNSTTADAIVESAFHGSDSIPYDGMSIHWREAADWSSWKRHVLDTESDIILMPVYHNLKDDAGEVVSFDKVIAWTSENSPVPVFAVQDYAVGDKGVAGAIVIAGEEHGRQAGSMARDILAGKSMNELLAAPDQKAAYYFNRNQLRRFELVLPEALSRRAIFK